MQCKYDLEIYDLFSELFRHLPLGHCINKKIFVVHGGLFTKDGITLDEISRYDRITEPPDEGIMCELLWSDPCDENGRHPSKRGVGIRMKVLNIKKEEKF